MTSEQLKPLTQISPDIYQLRLPLPFALNHVNCYLLQGKEGWTIIDTGLNIPEARALWEETFETFNIGPDDIDKIVLTHVHPDHYGLAGWLQKWSGASIWMSPREAELARQIWGKDNLPHALLDLFHRAGLPVEIEREAGAKTQELRELTLPPPRYAGFLKPGQGFSTGSRQFRSIHAPGHSDGQLLFYDAEDHLLLSGDQVLLKITPNIGLWPISEPDPLGRYLASLQQLAGLEVRLALPGHRGLITDWPGRIAELQEHHARRLEEMLATLNGKGVTAYQVCTQVFGSQLSMHEIRFAVAETLAHLEYLVNQENVQREEGEVWLYRRA
jgi:glyoxylase-like metal-dependent hydrolase (beta-lactamase superfamily II)